MPVVPLPRETPELAIAAAGGAIVRRSLLPSGLRVLTEQMPGAQSASVGFWVPVGSRDEREDARGATHFLEHLLFKGTPTRSAFDIAVAFDEVGGEHNAVTAKEHTCYYAKVRDRDLPMAIDVLADMVTSSVLDPDEFERERGVILEELAMADDDPADVASERLAELVHGDHPLGLPIAGTPESIRAVSRDRVMEHYREHYGPGDVVVTVAGALDHDRVVAQLQEALVRHGWSLAEGRPRPRRDRARVEPGAGGLTVVDRPLEQVNLIMGMPGLVSRDDRRGALAVLNTVLGSGMSSRLFQEVRERRGLAYAVYSYSSGYADAGLMALAAACAPRSAVEVATLMAAELERLAEGGVDADELRRAKGQLAGGSALALEDSDARMSRLGRAELSLGELADLDAALERIDAVTDADVRALAGELAAGPRSIAAVGPAVDGLDRLVAGAARGTVEATA
ncbi:pitrilysin family protein [Agrococcus sp. SL85]|uniref:M16 family metallopeptidase n=1 Tax=Agrococcus sp. SL85 TaxID=2995141 RepID=UPI00226D07CE|nr:pitrilysin family protein [Agrococcus sp. SL85]WAC66276.1 pitrilysin family protein [Agrococcus sp. SL85]